MAAYPNRGLVERRRRFLLQFSSLGLSSTLLPGVLWAKVQEGRGQRITKAMLRDAEQIAGVQFDDVERDLILTRVNENVERYEALRKVPLPNEVPSALRFSPILPGMTFETTRKPLRISRLPPMRRPRDLEDVAFWPVTHLGRLLRSKQVTSSELTAMYLTRLRRYDGRLHCVVTLTGELARQQARRADADLAAGRDRGPLLGIPWGVKDIVATKSDKTSWGSALYQDQKFDYDATVVERLERAGAVLIAKLSTGELAYDDVWSDGTQEYQTRNPWDPTQGSNGSSAGPASATAAGLVGFAIGTETGGSILYPASRCGVTGLRPTFGRVSRRGVMTVAGSLDKVGCLCRTVEDGALVLDAIHGPDGHDLTVIDVPFNWDARRDVSTVRIGYLQAAFTEDRPEAVREGKAFDDATLDKLRALGFQLQPISLPDLPINETALLSGLFGELSATWDHLIRNRSDRMMTRHAKAEFGSVCRAGRLVPAVEYIQASRVRTLLMEAMDQLMKQVDVYVAPVSDPAGPIADANLALTNLTGHPALVLPNGFTRRGAPLGISFIGRLYGEAELLAVAKAYQDATEFHRQHPQLS